MLKQNHSKQEETVFDDLTKAMHKRIFELTKNSFITPRRLGFQDDRVSDLALEYFGTDRTFTNFTWQSFDK